MPGAKAGHPETAMADAAKHRKGRRTATDIAASERCFKMRVSRHAIVLSRSQPLNQGDGRWKLLRLRTRALWFWKEPCSSVQGRAQARPIRRAQRCIRTAALQAHSRTIFSTATQRAGQIGREQV